MKKNEDDMMPGKWQATESALAKWRKYGALTNSKLTRKRVDQMNGGIESWYILSKHERALAKERGYRILVGTITVENKHYTKARPHQLIRWKFWGWNEVQSNAWDVNLSRSLAGVNLSQFKVGCLLRINSSRAILCYFKLFKSIPEQIKNIGNLR